MAEQLQFTVLGKGDASDLERLAAAVDRFADKLKDLDRQKAEPKLDIDTRRAERQVGAFAENLKRRIGRAIDSLPDIEIDADSSDAEREIAAVRAELASLADQHIGVDVDTETARRQVAELEQRLRALNDADVSVSMRADVESALAELRRASGEVDRLDGRTAHVKVDVDRGLGDTIVQVAALGRALQTLAIPAAAVAAAPTIAAIGSAAVSAIGAVGLLPATLAEAGIAAATLATGLHGVGDALSSLDDAKKFGEALKGLAPSAREFAVAVRDIAPAWRSVRLDTQQALFAGLGEQMRQLSSAYLPSMRAGLTGVAAQFNGLATDLVTFARESQSVANVDTIFRNTAAALQAARPAATNLAAAFVDIATVGSSMLPELASGLSEATGRFREFISQARESGQLQQWIQGGIDTLETLGSIAVNVGSTLLSVFNAQKAAGADLLNTLDQLTAGMANWAKSAEGQRVLVTVFQEIRSTIDAVRPGLEALGLAAVQAVAAFANTGALTAAGQAFSAMAQAVAPLLPALAELAGGVVSNLASAFSAVASAVGPIVSALTGLLGALGPIPAAVAAVVIAFKALGPIGAAVTTLGTRLSGLAGKVGASEAATGRLAKVFSSLGSAVPIAGAALVGVIAVYDQLRSHAEESAKAVADGSMTMKQAIDQEIQTIQAQRMAYEGLQGEGYAVGQAIGEMTGKIDANAQAAADSQQAVARLEEKWRAYRDTLSPFQQLQADVTRAQGELNDAMASGDMAAAAAAADRLAEAQGKLQAAEDGAAAAAQTHADAVNELSGAMQSQIGSSLAYEEALKRTADAHKEANDALKKNGASSEEYKARVLDLAQAQESQAQASKRAVEAQLQGVDANTRADASLKAYNLELLKLNDGTQAGRDAFVQLASGLDNTGLSALSAAAAATGLKTEILTLPDGRTVTIVTSADTASIDTYKQQLEAVAAQKYVGTITVVGDPAPFRDGLIENVQFANGQRGVITLDGNDAPIRAKIGANKYTIDATTGVMTIDGNPAPGEANLTGFKLKVDSTTGQLTIEANAQPADAARTEVQQPTQSEHTINPNTGEVDAAEGRVQQPTQSEHTINPNTGAVDGAKTAAQAPTQSLHTIIVDQTGIAAAKNAARVATESLHTIKCDDKAVLDAKRNAEMPTESMHTIKCNDQAVRDAKAAASRPTSSTHTIHVVTVGGGPGRAAGAYTTPGRAQGAYAAPMARGGMRQMSAARAEIVPPRQPRVIGDRMQGDEAFIPINRTARSVSILKQAANRMGYEVTPTTATGTSDAGAALSSIRTAPGQRAGSAVRLDDTRVVAALDRVERALAAQPRQIHNEIVVNAPNQAADEVSRVTRRQAALGLFG